MPTISIAELINAYSLDDYGAGGSGRVAARINDALVQISQKSPANGLVLLGPRVHLCETPIVVPSNITLMGFGTVSELRLAASIDDDVVKSENTSNIRLCNLRINGNRANNTGANRYGLWLYGVEDAWLDNVEVVSARRDGFRLDSCTRIKFKACSSSDNGRHGFSLSYAQFCQLMDVSSYDNSRVADAGEGDGINLEVISTDTLISNPNCYETSLTGDRQGWGIREAVGESCARTIVLGGSFRGNRTGTISLESGDSLAITSPLIQLPGGVTITP